jgi:two-component system, sensor histidine kinase
MRTADVESHPRSPEPPGQEEILAAELIRAQCGNMPGAFIGSAVSATFVVALAALPFLLGGDAWHVAIGVGALAALPLVLRYADRLCRALRASIEVRLQNADLVEQLRAQKKAAEEANVAKSRFLAVASHDLRQPLHALELFVHALEDTPLPTQAQQLVANVRRCVDSMEELFDVLLDISRLDAGVVTAREEVIPLAEVFERLAFEYTAIAQQKGLSLRVMKTSVCVLSDPTLLARIVRNLVANALRYTERGSVTIGCRRRSEHVSIEVWDTGPGIPPEKCAEVFREFVQLGNPERDRRKGLGLGLAIVDRLARLLGHTVQLRSTVGRGSVFSVSVPRVHVDAETILERTHAVAARFDLKGRLVLLIHGDLARRDDLRKLLESWNCEVIAAGSATQLKELLCALRRPPDLIIVEHPARDETNAGVVEMLRNEFNVEVPALLVGAALGAPVESGGLPVLYQPFNAGRLRTLIDNLLHAPPARARRAS